MSRLLRCRRCGALFVADRFAALLGRSRLCPSCRGPVPPSGDVPATNGGVVLPCPPEAAP